MRRSSTRIIYYISYINTFISFTSFIQKKKVSQDKRQKDFASPFSKIHYIAKALILVEIQVVGKVVAHHIDRRVEFRR